VFCGDRVSINRCTLLGEVITGVFPNSIYIDCHLHTCDNSAAIILKYCEVVTEFWGIHVGIFARSTNANSLYKQVAEEAMQDYSDTRFFGQRDAMAYVKNNWNKYLAFLRHADNADAGPTTTIWKMKFLLLPEL